MFQFYGDLLEFYKVMILFIKERFETISIWCFVIIGIDGYNGVQVRSREDQEGRPWFFPFMLRWDIPGRSNSGF